MTEALCVGGPADGVSVHAESHGPHLKAFSPVEHQVYTIADDAPPSEFDPKAVRYWLGIWQNEWAYVLLPPAEMTEVQHAMVNDALKRPKP